MEFHEYGRILLRRWWLLLTLPVLVGLFSVLTYREPPVTFAQSLQYSVSFLPIIRESLEQDPRLGAVQASEYVADDLTQILAGSRFAASVQARLPEGTSAAIVGAVRAEKEHRLVTINLAGETSEQVAQLGVAVKQAVEEEMEALLGDLWGTGELRLELVDERGPFPVGSGLRSRLDVPLRVALALVAAAALAFALDYLDDSVRSRAEVERLVGPVLGEIPK